MYSELPLNHIRLLLIEHESASIELLTVNVDDIQDFEALSYTWGSPICSEENEREYSISKEILVSTEQHGEKTKHTVRVTRNLYEAIEELMLGDHAIWIDAICINQADLQEKAQQVAFMAEIYSRAKVLVWLGVDDGTYDELRHLHTEVLDKIIAFQPREFDVLITSDRVKIARADIEFDPAPLWKLYGARRWINRAWTTQEVLLAKDKDVWILRPFIHFSRIGEMAWAMSGPKSHIPSPSNGSSGVGQELVWLRHWSNHMKPNGDDIITLAYPDYFSQIFFFLQNPRLATDPRDIIYSLHSMIVRRTRPQLTIDYTKPLFRDFTIQSFQHTLQALSHCILTDERPSWLPDYTSLPGRYQPDRDPWPDFPGPGATFDENLRLHGRRISTITSPRKVLDEDFGDGADQEVQVSTRVLQFYQGDLPQFLQMIYLRSDYDIEGFESFVLFEIISYRESNRSDLLNDYIAALKKLPIELDIEYARHIDYANAVEGEEIQELMQLFDTRRPKLKSPIYTQGTRIFYTAGLYGRTEGPLEAGDELWFLCGAKLPFILRPSGTSYRIVAEAFVPYTTYGRHFEPGSPVIFGEIEELVIE